MMKILQMVSIIIILEQYDLIDTFIDLYNVTENEATQYLKKSDFNLEIACEEYMIKI